MRANLRIAAAASLAVLAGIAASVGRVRAITPPVHAAMAKELSRIVIDRTLTTVDDQAGLAPVVSPTCRWSETTRSFSWLFP